jgi:hypothetical protein
VCGSGVVETENHYTHGASFRQRRDFSEIKIEGEDDSTLRNGLREDFTVRKAVKTLLAKVNRLVTLFSKPRNDAKSTPLSARNLTGFSVVYWVMWTCS